MNIYTLSFILSNTGFLSHVSKDFFNKLIIVAYLLFSKYVKYVKYDTNIYIYFYLIENAKCLNFRCVEVLK